MCSYWIDYRISASYSILSKSRVRAVVKFSGRRSTLQAQRSTHYPRTLRERAAPSVCCQCATKSNNSTQLLAYANQMRTNPSHHIVRQSKFILPKYAKFSSHCQSLTHSQSTTWHQQTDWKGVIREIHEMSILQCIVIGLTIIISIVSNNEWVLEVGRLLRSVGGCVYAMCVNAAAVDNYVRAAHVVLANANDFRNPSKTVLISDFISADFCILNSFNVEVEIVMKLLLMGVGFTLDKIN